MQPENIFEKIGSVEKWFFKKEIARLFEDMNSRKDGFIAELHAVTPAGKPETVQGVRLLVGAEVLFDPAYSVDYPLDSYFGNELEPALR